MPINSADFQIDSSGNIRRASSPATSNVYSVLDLHAWLQDLADNAAVSGDDSVSILSANPSKLDGPRDATVASRLNLINSFNIDDTVAQFINAGSIKQAGGNTLYSGLKTIGGIVAGSSMYVVQGSSKVTKYWSSGHIRVMLKVKNGGSLISGGQVTVFSRQYGQKYSHFDVDMSAGGENPAAMSTEVDSNISLTLSAALALASKVTITVGATTLDLNNGNGSRNYSGTIALDGTISLAQLYQYLQAICSEDPSGSIGVSIGGVPGWRFRALGAFSENIAAPFGTFAGGKFFFAQGWAVTGVQVADATNYQLIDNTGATQSPPVNASIVVSNLADNDYVLVGRDTGSDIDQAEYTVNGAIVGSTSLVVTPSIKTDTPSSGVVRVNGVRYTYTSWSGSTFTLSAPATISNGLPVFVPFIDQAVSGVTSLTASFKYNANFTYRVKVRSGSGSSPIIPFETTGTSTSGAASVAAVRTLDV